MALKFRNRQTGRVVAMAESDELAEQLAQVTHRGQPLAPEMIELAVKERKRTLDKLGDSWKWERVADSTPERPSDRIVALVGELVAPEPTPAEVRAWAAGQGIEVPARGKLSPDVIEAFKAAQES